MMIRSGELTGAKRILKTCLGLRAGQNLLVFADETTHRVAGVINEAAFELQIPTTISYIPTSQQRHIPKEIDLNDSIQYAAKEARAILTCVSSAPDCLPFRKRILESQWTTLTRIGHMPGASLKILELANVDMDKLIDECHRIELAMARGKELRLVTRTSIGEEHELRVEIGGWKRLPVASNGLIEDGVWGNVPSGETYIAPLENTAQGTIVINGSIPGMVVKKKQEIVLHFSDGQLVEISPLESPVAIWLQKTQIAPAIEKGDGNWNNLAEVGIGVNPGVLRLNGNMLFDEKCAGTAHIALGTNNYMGGTLVASIHCDMVIKRPSVYIDNVPIVIDGELVIRAGDWLDNFTQVSMNNSPLLECGRVCLSGTQVEKTASQLMRVLRSEPGRVSYYPVGDEETCHLALRIYNLLPADNDWIEIHELVKKSGLKELAVRQLLHVMTDHELIRFV